MRFLFSDGSLEVGNTHSFLLDAFRDEYDSQTDAHACDDTLETGIEASQASVDTFVGLLSAGNPDDRADLISKMDARLVVQVTNIADYFAQEELVDCLCRRLAQGTRCVDSEFIRAFPSVVPDGSLALDQRLTGVAVTSVTVLQDGRVAFGARHKSGRITICLLNLTTGDSSEIECGDVFEICQLEPVNDETLVSVSEQGVVRLWSTMTCTLLNVLRERVAFNSVLVLPDSRVVCCGCTAGIWNITKKRFSYFTGFWCDEEPSSILLVPGNQFLLLSTFGVLRLRDACTGNLVVAINAHCGGRPRAVSVAALHHGVVAVGTSDGSIYLWHVKTSICLGCILRNYALENPILSITMLPDGNIVARSCINVFVLNTWTGECIEEFTADKDSMPGMLRLLPDGGVVFPGSGGLRLLRPKAAKTCRLEFLSSLAMSYSLISRVVNLN